MIPVYGCEECLFILYRRLIHSLSEIVPDFEIIFINDYSPDSSWTTIEELAKKDNRVRGINFSRNFGQHYAITAGLDYAKGKWIVVMDCDLQDQPEEIIKLYNKAQEGFDIVYAISPFRGKNGIIYNLMRKIYFKLYDFLAQNKFETSNTSFYIISAAVRDSVVKFREFSRHISSLIRYVGFKIVGVEIEHSERGAGKSSYTFSKRFQLAYTGIIAHSSNLLKLSLICGFLLSLAAFGFVIFIIIGKLLYKYILPGWTSLIVLNLFSTGLILSFLGVIGMYLEKMFLEIKNRPLYIIKDTLNIE